MYVRSCMCYLHDLGFCFLGTLSVLSVTSAVYLTSYPSLLVSGSEGVPVEVHEALYVAMERLQQRFTSLMQEKADLKERVEELEHRCIQLSGETDTIGERDTHPYIYSTSQKFGHAYSFNGFSLFLLFSTL